MFFRERGGSSDNEPDSDGDVNQRVSTVQDGQHRLVIVPEEALDIDLAQRKQPAERALMLKPQDRLSMVLRRLPDAIRGGDKLTRRLDADVEQKIDRPVEHLDEKRKLLYEARVIVLRIPARVGCVDNSTAACSFLGRVRIRRRRSVGEVETLRLVVDVLLVPWLQLRLAEETLVGAL